MNNHQDRMNRTPSIEVRIRPAAGVASSIHPDGMILLHATRGQLYSANSIGALIWSSILAGNSLNRIATELACVYDVLPAVAEEGARLFCAELTARELLTREMRP